MQTIVGLGNPGKEFEGTRHNIGREAVVEIAKKNDCNQFVNDDKIHGLKTKCNIGSHQSYLLLPNTFMNKSGSSLTTLKTSQKNLVVVHDDSDLPLGTIKVSMGKNSAGHKGVESVMRAIKSKEFWRIRIGIGKKKHIPAEKLVLKKWSPEEKKLAKRVLKKVTEVFETDISQTTIRI